MKTKTFDCVEMKNRIQQQLRKEYEARANEFDSYAEFIRATAERSPEIQDYMRRLKEKRSNAPQR